MSSLLDLFDLEQEHQVSQFCSTFHAITLRQPWAWAVFHADKDVENRVWPTLHRGPLVIHAGKTRGESLDEDIEWIESNFEIEVPRRELEFGAVIGLVDLYDCQPAYRARRLPRTQRSDWAASKGYHWMIRNPELLPEPVEYRGLQKLFPITERRVVQALNAIL